MESKLYSIEETIQFIEKGKLLVLAGDERALSQLPKGNWIGGTIPYFMDIDKGVFSQDMVFVNELYSYENNIKLSVYDENNIGNIVNDSYENGFTLLILPVFQKVHEKYAIIAEDLEGLYNNPIMGWIAGMDLNSSDAPHIFDGLRGNKHADKAIAFHIKLPEDKFAQIEILNIFEQSNNSEDEITFIEDAFEAGNCLINGKETILSEYILEKEIDTELPLIADYSGANVNVSIKEVNHEKGIVYFYAPVFKSKTYTFPKPIENYVSEFEQNTSDLPQNNQFSCNCILNYLYGELENKKINNVKGPITFGEIAYLLVNQTLVVLTIEDN